MPPQEHRQDTRRPIPITGSKPQPVPTPYDAEPSWAEAGESVSEPAPWDAQDDQDDVAENEEEDEAGDSFDDGDEEEEERASEPAEEEESPSDEYTAESYLAGHLIPLPSGKSILVRPISLVTMLKHGAIPNALVPAARKLLYGNTTGAPTPQNRGERRAQPGQSKSDLNADDGAELMDWMVCQLVASFKVVQKPQSRCGPGELSVGSMFESDKNALVSFAMKGQKALTAFR